MYYIFFRRRASSPAAASAENLLSVPKQPVTASSSAETLTGKI